MLFACVSVSDIVNSLYVPRVSVCPRAEAIMVVSSISLIVISSEGPPEPTVDLAKTWTK